MVYWIQEPCDEMVSQYIPSSNCGSNDGLSNRFVALVPEGRVHTVIELIFYCKLAILGKLL